MHEWEGLAQELDILEGNDLWKLEPSTGDYTPSLIQEKLGELDDARTNCDVSAMMYLIRTALSRDLGGMGNTDLYRHSYVGTKELIENYVDSAVRTIDALVETSELALPASVAHKDLLEGMLHARQSFGRSALLLSGGATFGMTHIGVLKALFEAKLLPRIISGASAGSIVCSVMCTRTDEELPEVIKTFPYGDLAVFEESGKEGSVLEHLRRLLTEGSWSDIAYLKGVMRGLLGDLTFQEAYNRTRRILNICVSTASIYELPRLLNYITAPNVMIWSAVAASCSVPLVFSAAPLLVKNPTTGEHIPWNPTPQGWIDGSVDNDLPMTRLAEMFNVNHFIVSQVNPHVVPFLARDDQLDPGCNKRRRPKESPPKDELDWVFTLTTLAKDEALHRMQFLAEIGIFPNLVTKLRSILSQRYSGDINILPEISIQDLPKILKNPTSEFMLRSCLSGERATWPKLSRIRDRLAIELALDRAVHRLRARVVFSDSQVDLRRMATGTLFPYMVDSMHSAGPVDPTSEMFGYHRSAGRKRRSSGSNIHLATSHRRTIFDSSLTDDDTEAEERLEMVARHGHGTTTPVLLRKPRLKRAAKSHYNMPLHRGLLATPMSRPGVEVSGFDFSKPMTPPLRAGSGLLPQSYDAGPAETAPEPFPKSPESISRAAIASPTEDLVTSEIHSSDGDVESHTDDSVSDPDPYDGFWLEQQRRRTPERSAPNNGEVGQEDAEERRSSSTDRDRDPPSPIDMGGGLWD
jgi:TAG lipase / steryl ester hydrolase / phospholipase A2 / LPA acyltransferase